MNMSRIIDGFIKGFLYSACNFLYVSICIITIPYFPVPKSVYGGPYLSVASNTNNITSSSLLFTWLLIFHGSDIIYAEDGLQAYFGYFFSQNQNFKSVILALSIWTSMSYIIIEIYVKKLFILNVPSINNVKSNIYQNNLRAAFASLGIIFYIFVWLHMYFFGRLIDPAVFIISAKKYNYLWSNYAKMTYFILLVLLIIGSSYLFRLNIYRASGAFKGIIRTLMCILLFTVAIGIPRYLFALKDIEVFISANPHLVITKSDCRIANINTEESIVTAFAIVTLRNAKIAFIPRGNFSIYGSTIKGEHRTLLTYADEDWIIKGDDYLNIKISETLPNSYALEDFFRCRINDNGYTRYTR